MSGIEELLKDQDAPAESNELQTKVSELEQKYSTLQGVYSSGQSSLKETQAELAKAQGLLQESQRNNELLFEKLSNLGAPKEEKKSPYSQEALDNYGPILNEVETRLAQIPDASSATDKIAQAIDALNSNMESLKGEVALNRAEAEKARIYSTTPGLAQAEQDPRFSQWSQSKKMLGWNAQDLLVTGQREGNTEVVKEIISAFYEDMGETPQITPSFAPLAGNSTQTPGTGSPSSAKQKQLDAINDKLAEYSERVGKDPAKFKELKDDINLLEGKRNDLAAEINQKVN